ncbi:MAG: hypothetical protein ABI192_01535 [Bradyrhizobium sp.]
MSPQLSKVQKPSGPAGLQIAPTGHHDGMDIVTKYTNRAWANGNFSRDRVKKASDIRPALAGTHNAPAGRLVRVIRGMKNGSKIGVQYQPIMSVIELARRARYSEGGRRKFGRIYQRFWFVRRRGSWRLQSESSFPFSLCYPGRVFSAVPLKEHDA